MKSISEIESEYDLEVASSVKEAHRLFDSFEEKIYFINGVNPEKETVLITNPLEKPPRRSKEFHIKVEDYSPEDSDRFYPVKLNGMKMNNE